jgi:hypothetical protein
MYIPTLHNKFFALKIEIQYSTIVQHFLFFIQEGIWNLDHLLTCGIPYADTDGIPRNSGNFYCKKYRGIPRNSVCFSKNSVFRRKSKTHFRGHPTYSTEKEALYSTAHPSQNHTCRFTLLKSTGRAAVLGQSSSLRLIENSGIWFHLVIQYNSYKSQLLNTDVWNMRCMKYAMYEVCEIWSMSKAGQS